MEPNQSNKNNVPPAGDQNVERLLKSAYAPQDPSDAFVRRAQAAMLAAARKRAGRYDSHSTAGGQRRSIVWSFARKALVACAAAAIIVGAVLIVRAPKAHDDLAVQPTPTPAAIPAPLPAASPAPVAIDASPAPIVPPPLKGPEHLTPRAAPPPPATLARLAVGDAVRTAATDRKRLTLPDGSVLYMNADTAVTLTADRRIDLSAGEIFVEVQPRPQEPDANEGTFVVRTPTRQVTAMGTQFSVRAQDTGTAVIVTQGKVRVSGLDELIYAGRQLLADNTLAACPRPATALEWMGDLVAMAHTPLVPQSEHAGGSLVAATPEGAQVQLSLRKYHVDVHIEDGFARTTIDQTYFNSDTRRLEGTFYFPLPADASLSRLAMYVDGKLMEGGMAERDHARNVFESIVRRMKDPALLEWVDGTTFKMRVFPLEGRQEKRIILSYSQRLPADSGKMIYRFPGGHSLQSVRDWSFHARLKNASQATPLRWSCESHAMQSHLEGSDFLLDASAHEARLDRDVVLQVTDPAASDRADAARLSWARHEGANYLMLRYQPSLATDRVRPRRDWVVLFESSADRSPLLARAQIEVVRALLRNIEHDDRFAVLTVSTHAYKVTDGFAAASAANIQAAMDKLQNAHLVGALDLESGLAAAGELLKDSTDGHLVHVGNGTPVLGQRRQESLVAALGRGVRYVGVGVGRNWNRSFMKAAAAATDGCFTQINPDENIAWRAFELLASLNTPRLMNVKVVDAAEAVTFLTDADSVSHGQEICAIARIDNGALPATLKVTGMLSGRPWSRTVSTADATPGADYLPRSWARLEIDRLVADGAEKNKARIIDLSKAMYVMSPFTSLLVLENEAMYSQYNIDRGRKDHWALYPCPPTIAVVTEPAGPNSTPGPTAAPAIVRAPAPPTPSNRWATVQEALGTIMIRLPAVLLPQGAAPARAAQTALELYEGAYAIPVEDYGVTMATNPNGDIRVTLPTNAGPLPNGLNVRGGRLPLRMLSLDLILDAVASRSDKHNYWNFSPLSGVGPVRRGLEVYEARNNLVDTRDDFIVYDANAGFFALPDPEPVAGPLEIDSRLRFVPEGLIRREDSRTITVDDAGRYNLAGASDGMYYDSNSGQAVVTGIIAPGVSTGSRIPIIGNGYMFDGAAAAKLSTTPDQAMFLRNGIGAWPRYDNDAVEFQNGLRLHGAIRANSIDMYGGILDLNGGASYSRTTDSLTLHDNGRLSSGTSRGSMLNFTGTPSYSPATNALTLISTNTLSSTAGINVNYGTLSLDSSRLGGAMKTVTFSGGGLTLTSGGSETMGYLSLGGAERQFMVNNHGGFSNAVQVHVSNRLNGSGILNLGGNVSTYEGGLRFPPTAEYNRTLTAGFGLSALPMSGSGWRTSDSLEAYDQNLTINCGGIVFGSGESTFVVGNPPDAGSSIRIVKSGAGSQYFTRNSGGSVLFRGDINGRISPDNSGAATTFAGSITGSVALTKSGTGQWLLAGNNEYPDYDSYHAIPVGLSISSAIVSPNAYTGGTYINGGTLSAGRALGKGGAGTLHLSAANTYSGATYVNAGTLTLNAANTLGAFSGNNSIIVGDSTADGVFDVDSDYLLAIQAGLRKNGDGSLYINGTQTYGTRAIMYHNAGEIQFPPSSASATDTLPFINASIQRGDARIELSHFMLPQYMSSQVEPLPFWNMTADLGNFPGVLMTVPPAAQRVNPSQPALARPSVANHEWVHQMIQGLLAEPMMPPQGSTINSIRVSPIVLDAGETLAGMQLAAAAGQSAWPTWRKANSLLNNPHGQALLHRPVRYRMDDAKFNDLLQYAPGLNTSIEDVQAVLEAEGPAGLEPAAGTIDPRAARLIEQCRKAPWQSIIAAGPDGGSILTFDGAGRYVSQGRTPSGLAQTVICDGNTIVHVYGELGLASRRSDSRFHRRAFIERLPWLVPPTSDLAVGANVTLAADNTVAIQPLSGGAAEQLVFGAAGTLVERRLVQEGKVLSRQTYAADGGIMTYDANGVATARVVAASPAVEPNLKPDLAQLVVLPMPIRSIYCVRLANGAFARRGIYDLDDEKVFSYVVSCLGEFDGEAATVIGERFIARGDRRLGLYVLLLAAGTGHWDAQRVMHLATQSVTLEPRAQHPLSPTAAYVQAMMSPASGDANLPAAVSSVALLHDLAMLAQLQKPKASESLPQWLQSSPREVLAAMPNFKTAHVAWAAAALAVQAGPSPEITRQLVAATEKPPAVAGLSPAVRFELATALRAVGESKAAAAMFDTLFRESVAAGEGPMLNFTVVQTLREARGEEAFGQMVKAVASQSATGGAPALTVLAAQCEQLGQPQLATHVQRTIATGTQLSPPLAAIRLRTLLAAGLMNEAWQAVQTAAADPELASNPWLWRAGFVVSEALGRTADATMYLDRLLDMEYQQLGETVEVPVIEAQYGALMSHYQDLFREIRGNGGPLTQDLLARVVRAADRWRALTGNDSAACAAAANIFMMAGENELSWEYSTSPLASRPGEPAPLANLGRQLHQASLYKLAALAFAAAFQADPTDPGYLLEQARTLKICGDAAGAETLYRQIANGDWRQQFDSLKRQAKEELQK